MNSDLRRLVHDRLCSEDSLTKNWSSLVLAACDGRDALDSILQNAKTTAKADEKATATTHAGAHLTCLIVEDGGRATGLTIVVGRNGSGNSSFAEALEVLLTGDSKRWMDRSKIWKEGRGAASPASASTRLSVGFLLELAGSGVSQTDILSSYPQLSAEALAAAFAYAAKRRPSGSNSAGPS